MNTLSNLITGPGVYLAVAVFLLGLVRRLAQWGGRPASPMNLGLYPKPAPGTRTLRIVTDSLVFPQLAEVNPSLWVVAILFHVALLGVLVGHLHIIGRFPGALEAQMSASAPLMGGIMGVTWVLATLYFLIRRFKSPYKEMSTPEDYLLLLLVLGVVAMGDHLRFFAHVPVTVYQEWAHSLLTFHPALPAALEGGARISFVVHVLLADLLLAYLPFSKLVHFVGTFATNAIRRS